jgi:hypothetical protein
MLTLKFVSSPSAELLFEAGSVRRDGDAVYYTNEHEVEIEMTDLAGKTVYVMNEKGATVATYRL